MCDDNQRFLKGSEVMESTGHTSSLNAYKKPCLRKQQKMSEILCALYSGTCGPASDEARQPSGEIRTALGGVFSGAHLDGYT